MLRAGCSAAKGGAGGGRAGAGEASPRAGDDGRPGVGRERAQWCEGKLLLRPRCRAEAVVSTNCDSLCDKSGTHTRAHIFYILPPGILLHAARCAATKAGASSRTKRSTSASVLYKWKDSRMLPFFARKVPVEAPTPSATHGDGERERRSETARDRDRAGQREAEKQGLRHGDGGAAWFLK